MPHSAKVVALTATALLTAALLTLATPHWADAQQQIRLTFVRSIDEPGLNPYQEEIITSCPALPCAIQFPAVPAGRRLVVKHVSLVGVVGLGLVARLGTSDPDAASLLLETAQPNGVTSEFVMSQSVHYVVPGGLSPVIRSNATEKVGASVVGYLITP